MCIMEEFGKIKTTVEHQGYYYKISEIIKILILGLLCTQKTMSEIHGWASSKRISKLLLEKFSIKKIPCYSHFTVLVGMIDSGELNKIFMEFFCKLVETVVGKTIAIDGKTICSTANMGKYKSPVHIASAFVVENGITIGQLAAEGKWHGIQSLGAIVTESEIRYYISSRKLSPLELLTITRNEWAVESMHWQLDVIFNDDRTTLHEENAQKTLNILRKTVLNLVRTYRDKFAPKLNMVAIMRNCLFDDDFLLLLLTRFSDCV